MKSIYTHILGASLLAISVTVVTLAEEKHAVWSYEGKTGPEHWGELDQAWAVMKTGEAQSPVDIFRVLPGEEYFELLEFDYRESPLEVTNTGHSIQQNYAPGSFVVAEGKRYELKQFHFHSRSEHTVRGVQFPLEMHAVHAAEDGTLLVVGFLFELGPENPLLEPVFANMPAEGGETNRVSGVAVNLGSILPEDRGYYHYEGSLTTPPGTEGVMWYVLEEIFTLSPGQLELFRALYDRNFRPTQPVLNRAVFFRD